MSILLKSKKMIASMFASICLLMLAIPAPQASAASFGPYDVTSYSSGDHDGVKVYLGSGVNKITVNLKQWGIHSGETPNLTWRVAYVGGGEAYMKTTTGDGTATLDFSNLKHPGGFYTVNWISNNNVDTDGWYYVNIASGSVVK
ncbi:hypothetical protein [Bacillus mycoides]|uniref:hypothetical protein n=1 Tax=Bacillus mycoides TaxID=1405 RepID=UPI002E1EFF07|nr:hypothetical protein [Bacillus mycoides]